MKAVVLEKHGGLDELKVVKDFPDPKPIEGHVVIRVGATSFNYHDVFTVRGMPGIKVPMPMIIGLDLAGEVLEVGPGVSGWKPGDRRQSSSAMRFIVSTRPSRTACCHRRRTAPSP